MAGRMLSLCAYGPAVALVQQQVGGAAIAQAAILRLLEHLAHIRHSAGHSVELFKGAARHAGDDGRPAWFSQPGGPQRCCFAAGRPQMARRSSRPGPKSCSCPTNSSSVRGRMRSARGGREALSSRPLNRVCCSKSFMQSKAAGLAAPHGSWWRERQTNTIHYTLFPEKLQRAAPTPSATRHSAPAGRWCGSYAP